MSGFNYQLIQEQAEALIVQKLADIEQAILYNLQVVGEVLRNKAIEDKGAIPIRVSDKISKGTKPHYLDQSHHLRSSIGYIIVVNGEVCREGEFGGVGADVTEAKSEGVDYAKRLAREFPTGITLLLVAGKEYAYYLDKEGWDVLTSAELIAEDELVKAMKRVELGIKKL